jgi:hypothetical protein
VGGGVAALDQQRLLRLHAEPMAMVGEQMSVSLKGATKPCEVCGKPFRVLPSDEKRGRGRFCSHKCEGRYRSDPAIRERQFWQNVNKTRTCWLWKGPPHAHGGYGEMDKGYAHRHAFKLVHGYCPPRLKNVCGNKLCVRPEPKHWK